MIHVVDFEKTAFSTPFRGVLPPFGQQISAENGRATQSLAPGKSGWPPTSTWPLFSRPTPHQRGQVVRRPSPTGYCLTLTAGLPNTERDPISTSGPSIFSMSPNQAICSDKSIFSPRSPPPDR